MSTRTVSPSKYPNLARKALREGKKHDQRSNRKYVPRTYQQDRFAKPESKFTALLRKTYEEIYNDLEPEMRDRDQIIDTVLDMVDTDAAFRGRVREITRELDPDMRDADQIRDTVMEEARSELSTIANAVEAKNAGTRTATWREQHAVSPNLARKALQEGANRFKTVNKRRMARGKRPLGGGQPGDKPGHPFRGNQYS